MVCLILSLIGNKGTEEIIGAVISAVAVIFLAMPVHEFAHAFIADKLGDPTPRWQGRLTLNPIAHIDPIGALGILLFGIGWAKSVNVNARYFKSPKWGMALTALAGPVSNFITAFISVFFMALLEFISEKTGFSGILADVIWAFFYYLAIINIMLGVFNLIPIPPFDGSRILFAFLPTKAYFAIMKYERFIFIGLIILFATRILNVPLNLITGVVYYAFKFVASLPFMFI